MAKTTSGAIRSPFSITDFSNLRLLLFSGAASAGLWAMIALVL